MCLQAFGLGTQLDRRRVHLVGLALVPRFIHLERTQEVRLVVQLHLAAPQPEERPRTLVRLSCAAPAAVQRGVLGWGGGGGRARLLLPGKQTKNKEGPV